MHINTKELKLEIADSLSVSPKELSVKIGSGSLKYRILVQSRTVNIWENEELIAEVLPGFQANSAVMGMA